MQLDGDVMCDFAERRMICERKGAAGVFWRWKRSEMLCERGVSFGYVSSMYHSYHQQLSLYVQT